MLKKLSFFLNRDETCFENKLRKINMSVYQKIVYQKMSKNVKNLHASYQHFSLKIDNESLIFHD